MTTNTFLIYLILNHTKQVFGSYKYLIVAFSTMGLIFATAEFIVKPVNFFGTFGYTILSFSMTHNFNASFTFFTVARPFHCSKEVAMVLLAAYSSTYAATISLLAVQFVYRSRRVAYFNGLRILLWISIPVLFGVDWACSVYFLSMPDEYSKDYLGAVIAKHYDLNISQLAHFAAVVYDTENHIRWRSAMVMGSVSKVLSIQYAVMIYCGSRMHFKMAEKMEELSTKNRTMHRQLFKTLVVQITVPTFTIFLPVMLMFAIPFLDLEINIPTGPILCALSLYPFIDAIIVLCIVSDYRRASLSSQSIQPDPYERRTHSFDSDLKFGSDLFINSHLVRSFQVIGWPSDCTKLSTMDGPSENVRYPSGERVPAARPRGPVCILTCRCLHTPPIIRRVGNRLIKNFLNVEHIDLD
uniref:Uncharacterized protein n=1 Tax=Caenorhabditis japonica TaxID=281687 RepID=A0A8R1DXN5_CAEJA